MNAIYDKRSSAAPTLLPYDYQADGKAGNNPAQKLHQARAGLSFRQIRPEGLLVEGVKIAGTIITLYALSALVGAIDAGWVL